MAVKTITSGESVTPVGTSGTKLYTRTRTTYTLDENGKINPNSVKQEILYSQIPGDPPVIAATRIGTTGDFTFNKNEFTGKSYFGADAQKSLKQGALKTTTDQQIQTSAKKEGLTPEQQKAVKAQSNAATTDPNNPNAAAQAAQADADRASIESQLKTTKARKKGEYAQQVVYPQNLQLQYQDCMKFTMLRYEQSLLNPNATRTDLGGINRSVTVVDGIPRIGTREVLTTIVLPIPGGVSDSNSANWQQSELDEITKAFANIAQKTVTTGKDGLTQSVGEAGTAAGQNIKGLQALTGAVSAEIATGANGIMQRQYGAVTNPNLELLFNGPQLRSFSFTFRLSPRSEDEARSVKQIIRYFKQGMTPKRTEGYLLLQSPNTFAISYITSNKEHPYLNKFKECALTQCNVDYTPDGNYMSYEGKERSMTSYQLTLQFQELVPLFDDDYGSSDTNIGF